MGLMLLYWIRPRDNLGTNEVSLRFCFFFWRLFPFRCLPRSENSADESTRMDVLLTPRPKLLPNCNRGPGVPGLHNAVQSDVHDTKVTDEPFLLFLIDR